MVLVLADLVAVEMDLVENVLTMPLVEHKVLTSLVEVEAVEMVAEELLRQIHLMDNLVAMELLSSNIQYKENKK